MKEKNRFKKWTVLIIVFIPFLLASCLDSDNDSKPAVPRFEPSDCASGLVLGTDTECGYLIVPEDRSDPDSDTIELHVAILKARYPENSGDAASENTDTGPLVFLTGGPGTSTKSAFYIFDELYETGASTVFRESFGHGRDLIILDQRGTNRSEPSLYCSDELAAFQTTAYGMGYKEAADLRVEVLEGCYNRLENEGVDLSGYDTFENAADVKALRDALGYDKINLFGASYGTRLVMTVMKEYPEIIRSVVIDSILPPELNPLETQAEGTMFALNRFFEACKDDYPDTENRFYNIIDRLEATPVTVDVTVAGKAVSVEVTAVKFIAYIVSALRSTPYKHTLPATIKGMFENNTFEDVANSWIGIVDFFFTSGEENSYDPSVGMFESVTASSDGYYTTQDRIFDNIDFYMPEASLREWAKVEFYYWYPSTQGAWFVEPISPDSQYPVISDIPTLMLVGTLDAATPAIFSEPSSRYLSNSFYMEILAGHATTQLGCTAEMLDEFIIDPATEPTYLCETEYTWSTDD